MEEKKKSSIDKEILLDTIKVKKYSSLSTKIELIFKEYADYTTIHGINYVFASFLSFHDRF